MNGKGVNPTSIGCLPIGHKDLPIITEDTEGMEKIKGKTIRYVPLWKWLLA